MSPGRLRSYIDAAGVLLCEAVLLAFFVKAGGLLGSVDLVHFSTWAQQSGPETVLTALFRLLGICTSGWLLLGTATYGLGVLTGSRRLRDGSHLITPAAVRRVLDALAAVSVAASSVASTAALAGASPAPHGAAVEIGRASRRERG